MNSNDTTNKRRMLVLGDGKYALILEPDGRLHALRHGQKWNRDLVGDQLVLTMMQEIETLRERLAKLEGG